MPPRSPVGHTAYGIGEEKAMDRVVDEFGMTRVEGIVTSVAVQAAEMEEIYAGMLRLEGFALCTAGGEE